MLLRRYGAGASLPTGHAFDFTTFGLDDFRLDDFRLYDFTIL
jgi:hypothetical protein